MSRLALTAVLTTMYLVAPSIGHGEAIVDDRSRVEPLEVGPVALTSAERRARAELIRDTARAEGMTNAALLAGIGEIETGFAHCWSEATWACKGPASSSCGGGPVIAGSADGPCSAEQGGLGMFQFDAGTFSQTIAKYGPDIVTMQGNVDAVIPFLTVRAVESVDGISDEAEALAWMNSITIRDGDPDYEKWLYFVSWRYNGCKGCSHQINKYRSGTNKLRDEFGPEFWKVSGSTPPVDPAGCQPVPAGGRVIEESDDCFEKLGPDSTWRPATTGNEGASLWTYATDNATPANRATWKIAVLQDGLYTIDVYTDAALAKSTRAKYVVTHANGATDVVIDQTANTGYQRLGEFELTSAEPGSVFLGDNTGESAPMTTLMFDAVRVTPSDDGGCSAGGSGTTVASLALSGLLLRRRRRHGRRQLRR